MRDEYLSHLKLTNHTIRNLIYIAIMIGLLYISCSMKYVIFLDCYSLKRTLFCSIMNWHMLGYTHLHFCFLSKIMSIFYLHIVAIFCYYICLKCIEQKIHESLHFSLFFHFAAAISLFSHKFNLISEYRKSNYLQEP